jgi:serine/threonine protein kinase
MTVMMANCGSCHTIIGENLTELPEHPGRLHFGLCRPAKPGAPTGTVTMASRAKFEGSPGALMDFSSFRKIGVIDEQGAGVVELWEDARKRQVAMKILRAGPNFKWEYLEREVALHARVSDHPCVLKIIGWCPPCKGYGARIATEFMKNGSLGSVLEKVAVKQTPRFWTHTNIAKFIMGTIAGMRHLHSNKIVHCDLKPANLMVDDFGGVQIGDFGSAKFIQNGLTTTQISATPFYAAPETYGDDYPTEKADVFSFGLILYEILFGHPVFALTMRPQQLMAAVMDPNRRPKIEQGSCKMIVKVMLEKCWSVNAGDRATFDELLERFTQMGFKFFDDVDSAAVEKYMGEVL